MEIHQALTRSPTVRNILCRHEQVRALPFACLSDTCLTVRSTDVGRYGPFLLFGHISASGSINICTGTLIPFICNPGLVPAGVKGCVDPCVASADKIQLCLQRPLAHVDTMVVKVVRVVTSTLARLYQREASCSFLKTLLLLTPGNDGMQGEIFAAEGYGKVTGEVGVCIATSGPGATNLVTGLADALLDSVPMVAITGQVGTPSLM